MPSRRCGAELIPLADLITPNLAEAARLLDEPSRRRARPRWGAGARAARARLQGRARQGRARRRRRGGRHLRRRAAASRCGLPGRASTRATRTAPAARCRPPSRRSWRAARRCADAVAGAKEFVRAALVAGARARRRPRRRSGRSPASHCATAESPRCPLIDACCRDASAALKRAVPACELAALLQRNLNNAMRLASHGAPGGASRRRSGALSTWLKNRSGLPGRFLFVRPRADRLAPNPASDALRTPPSQREPNGDAAWQAPHRHAPHAFCRRRGLRTRISLFFAALFLVYGIHVPYFPVWLDWRGLHAAGDRDHHRRAAVHPRRCSRPVVAMLADRNGNHRVIVTLAWSALALVLALS